MRSRPGVFRHSFNTNPENSRSEQRPGSASALSQPIVGWTGGKTGFCEVSTFHLRGVIPLYYPIRDFVLTLYTVIYIKARLN